MAWKDFKSNTETLRFVARAIRENRLGHAYLVTGASSDKEQVALHVAAALNCEKQDGDACGKCASCRKIFEHSHPDVRIVRPESKARQISIDEVRELERSAYLKASEARVKVGLIVDADRLTAVAQDAFLKTLEEPPKSTVFLLLSSEPQQLKHTILSRCLRINLFQETPPEPSPREARIQQILKEWKPRQGASPLFQAYRLADALQSALTEARDEAEKTIEAQYEDGGYENLEAEQIKKVEAEKDAAVNALYRKERTQLVRVLQQHFRGWLLASPENPNFVRACEAIEKMQQRLNRNMNEPLVLEVALLELVQACQPLAAAKSL